MVVATTKNIFKSISNFQRPVFLLVPVVTKISSFCHWLMELWSRVHNRVTSRGPMVRREGSLYIYIYIYIYGSQGCCSFEAGIYLTTLRSSARTQMAKERRATEPDWWVAARDVGTYSSRVLMPRATCRGQRRGRLVSRAGEGEGTHTWFCQRKSMRVRAYPYCRRD